MITFPLLGQTGRLGNQLWQIASTLGIAHSRGEEASFPPWAYQEWFNIPAGFFTNQPGTPATDLVPYLPPQGQMYLQDYSLWADIDWQIHDWFQPSAKAAQHFLQYTDFWKLEPPVMSLHVRRGDNIYEDGVDVRSWKAAYHPLRPMSYYREALALREPDYQSVAVFSDDIEWCEEHFRGDMFYFFHGTPRPKEHKPEYHGAPVLDWIDLQLMTFCDLHILSNSTYSFWGAYLSHDRSPIYPWPYFGTALKELDAGLMFPENWTRLTHAPVA